MDRRSFLNSSAVAGFALPASGYFVAAESKPLRVGVIGTGWYGKCSIFRLLQVAPAEVVALCDVDKKMLAEAAEMVSQRQTSKKKPRTYHDYRDLLKEKDLDIVTVETPDHWHALPMIAACESGADVWVQKPISVDVAEGRAMVAAARKHNKVVPVVTQRSSSPPSATFESPAFDVVWQHRTYGASPDPHYPWGATFYGDKGTLKASVMSYDFIPMGGKTVHKDVTYELEKSPEDKTEKDLEQHVAPALRAHWLDFLKARENRSKAGADMEQGHIPPASCTLANPSQNIGRTLPRDQATNTSA